MKVKILPGGITAKEINTATNPMMGKRHANYESLLRIFEIDFTDLYSALAKIEKQVGGTISHVNFGLDPGEIREAELLDNGKIKVL